MLKEEIIIELVNNQDLIGIKKFIKENKNFSFDFTSNDGKNLLHYAASKLTSNTLSVIQILLENGLDPLAVNEKFISALDVAKLANNIPAMTIMKHYVNKRNQESQNYF